MAVKAKKINQLPDGTPDGESWLPFSDKNGKLFRMPAFLGGRQDYTFKSTAVVSRPTQTNAVVELFGDMTGIGKDIPVDMIMRYSDETGTTFTKPIKIEWQGATSLSNPKKSYSLDLLNADGSDFKVKFGDWISIESYHLKSNYSDVLGVRDIVIARTAKECWETRPIGQAYPWSKPWSLDASIEDLRDTGARGVIDGFACEVFINGESQGLYSWNLSKKRNNFNMDKSNPNHILVGAEQGLEQSFRSSPPYFIEAYWDFKNPKYSGPVPEQVASSMERLLSFIQSSTQEDFNNHVSEYFNVGMCYDYFILVILFMCTDNRHKNIVFSTYDGLIWTPSLYDMDRTIGIRHIAPNYGTIVGPEVFSDINDPVWEEALLYKKLKAGFKPEMDARYAELRNTVLNVEHLQESFSSMAKTYPIDLVETDLALWGNFNKNHRIVGSSVGQIVDYLIGRFDLLDPQFNYNPNPTALLI